MTLFRDAQFFPAGGMGGAESPPAGSGAEPRKQTHIGNNLLKIGLKSGLWCDVGPSMKTFSIYNSNPVL